jgi:HTH-type transcriptional regulator/antitoxin HigA
MASPNAYSPDYAVSPGSVLDEHRESAGLTQVELAQRLGFSPKHINRLIAGQEPVTPETALKLEAVFGLPAHVWLGLDARYREFQARLAEEGALETELPWLDRLPWRAMRKFGWIAPGLRGTALVRELRAFFGVGSLDYLPAVWSDVQAAYRKSAAFQSHEWALLAWLAHGEREAERISCAPFDAAALRGCLAEIKALSRLPDALFAVPLVEQCARAGVAVVFLPAPDGARVCGATRWLSKDKVLVQLSLRYRTDDQLWFTLFHELGHVLLHGKREQFIDFASSPESSEAEREADEFAARNLVAPADLHRFILAANFTRGAVEQFAATQGVSAGIVVGQLQHRKVVPFNSALNKLKSSFRWAHESKSA